MVGNSPKTLELRATIPTVVVNDYVSVRVKQDTSSLAGNKSTADASVKATKASAGVITITAPVAGAAYNGIIVQFGVDSNLAVACTYTSGTTTYACAGDYNASAVAAPTAATIAAALVAAG